MELRPYQKNALNKIWEDIQTDLNVLLQGSTGCGKTIMFSKLIQRFLREQPHCRCLILVDREILVTQSRDKLLRVAPELIDDIGICCSSVQSKKELEHRVTIASRQTLINQLNYFAPVNIIILDEAHLASIPQEGDPDEGTDQFSTIINTLRKYNPKTRLIGFSATPYRLSSGYIYGDKNTKGSLPYFPELNYKIEIQELMNQGFLSPLIAKTIVSESIKNDLVNCKITAGEFNLGMLSDMMSSGIHVNSAVEAYKEYAIERKKTLCFCVSIEHSEIVARAFNEAGIPAIAIHSKLEDDDLAEAMNSLEDGHYKVFCSVAKLTTGLDVPDIDCILALRPTKSTSLWIQMIGRGLRTAIEKGKIDCFCLDLVGNLNEHGTNLDKPRVFYKLVKKSDKELEDRENEKQCPECSVTVHVACRVCPECDYVFNYRTEIHTQPELIDVTIGPDIRTFNVVNWTQTLNVGRESGKTTLKIALLYEDEEANYRNKIKAINIFCCFPGDGYSGFAVRKMQENLGLLSHGEISGVYPDTAQECLELAIDLLQMPKTVTVDLSGKWPELKSFSYDYEAPEYKQDAFGGQFQEEDNSEIPF